MKELLENLDNIILLLERNLDNVRKEFPHLNDMTWDWAKKIDPTPQKKYLQWIIKRAFPDERSFISDQTGDEIKNGLKTYEKFKNQTKHKDIYKYEDLSSFLNDIANFLDKKNKKNAKKDVKKYYEDSKWVLLQPLTYEASVYYGKGTKWCISSKKTCDLYDTYADKNGVMSVYFLINKKNNQKYAMSRNSGEIKDELDHKVSYISIYWIVEGPSRLWNMIQKLMGTNITVKG